jgi:hypothetical protein
MFNAKAVLCLHVIGFFTLVSVSATSPLLRIWHQQFYFDTFVPCLICFAIIVMGSWRVFKGCPLTVWENNLRQREGKPVYHGSCIVHYLAAWTGISLKRSISTGILVLIMLFPVAVGLVPDSFVP